jgi:glycosyltransferase involved in cell wall biosynthesis
VAESRPLALVLVFNTVTVDSRVLREARTLRGLGFEVLIAGVVSAKEQQTELEIDGFPVVRLAPVESLRRLLRRSRTAEGPPTSSGGVNAAATPSTPASLAPLRRLAIALTYLLQGITLLRRTSPVLVHANDYNTMWIGVAAKRFFRSRLVYDAHELWPDRDGRAEWRPWLLGSEFLFIRVADATLTVSPGVARVIASRYHVRQPIVVRNIPEYRHDALSQPRRPDQPPQAVYVGVLAPSRGLEDAVEALAAVPELRLRLIGSGDACYALQLAQRAEAAGAGDRFEIQAAVPPAHVTRAIVGADIGLVLIQPTSLSHRMSLPNKLFEYVAAGVPVIATDLPVLGPLVHKEGIGEIVPPGNIAAVAQAMRRLAEPARGAEARKHVRAFAERVSWERERRLLEEVYTGLTSRHEHASRGRADGSRR